MSTVSATNLAAILDYRARQEPDREAVVCGDRRLTYKALEAQAALVARALLRSGLRHGDHVALSCPNLPYFPIVYFGILKAGGVVVPLNVLLKSREIAYHLADSDAKVYFCFEGTPELPMAQFGKAAVDDVPSCEQFVVLPSVPGQPSSLAGVETLDAWLAASAGAAYVPGEEETAPVRADDTAVMLYTSGTTGQPKGAELTHANMILNALFTRDLKLPAIDVRVGGANVELITLPLFHSFGQTCQMNAGMLAGATLVLVPRFEPKTVLELMVRERVNFWSAVPTMYWALLQYAKANAVDVGAVAATFRLGFSGGAPMPVELLREFESTFGVRVLEGYGLSETTPVATFSQMMRPSKPGTVGQALPAVEVRCVDDEDRPVPVGEPGEVVIRGHNLMKGYYKRPQETAEAFRGGWFHSGDIGVLDADGYLSIVDRKKDMILRGGYNVYPRELEELLMTHPAVSLCTVIGIPDDRLGEEVKAYIVPKPGTPATESEIVDWCRERLAAFKCPRYVEFRASLPMTATGKILKRELRAEK
ncbi:MAG: long-chain fatty acid--CoA ligase [Vicinamibacterales bacterium]